MSFYECRLVLIPFRSMIWAHSPAATQLFFRPQRSTVDALTLVGRSGSRLDIVDDLLATAIPRRSLA